MIKISSNKENKYKKKLFKKINKQKRNIFCHHYNKKIDKIYNYVISTRKYYLYV
jgi:hypothetical protein